jgi:hypothetical protein
MAIPWATGDAFGDPALSTAVVLAEGEFMPGADPEFYSDTVFRTTATVYTAVGTSTMVPDPVLVDPVMTIRRTNESSPDYNGDGTVNAPDYTVWRNSLGQMGFGLPADGIRDGVIDGADFDFWKANYGLVIPGAGAGGGAIGSAGSVPEPATAALLAGATAFVFLRPKRGLSRSVRFP